MDKKFIDENMISAENNENGISWHKVDSSHMDLYGIDASVENSITYRIPESIAEKCNNGVLDQCKYSAGVRLRFGTDSKTICIRAEFGKYAEPISVGCCSVFGFDLYKCEDNGQEVFRHLFRPPVGFDKKILDNDPYTAKDTGFTYYTLNFPLFSEVKELYIGIESGSTLSEGISYVNELPVVFYGSSITHGAAASRPGNIYEGFISQKYNLNYTNLGFAGSARGEEAIAEYIAGRKMSAFVCDYDYNAPTEEHLRKTHYKFYEIIRKNNPDIPYIMISRPNYFHDVKKAKATRKIIYESYKKALDSGDSNVYFIDGETLLQGDFMESCTLEGVHPNDFGFKRMADIIGKKVFEVINKDK